MLKQRINDDVKVAMKRGDTQRRLTLSLLQSAIKNKELQKRAKSGKEEELNDEEVLDVIASEAKKRKESIESYEKGGREEMAQKERDELNILMEYMPEQMSEEQIREEAKKVISELELKEGKVPRPQGAGIPVAKGDLGKMGKVLGVLMPKLKGRVDGQTVSRIVKEELTR